MAPLLAETVVIFDLTWVVPVVVVFGIFLQDYTLYSQLPVLSSVQILLPMVIGTLLISLFSNLPTVRSLVLVIRSRRQTRSLLVGLDTAHRQLAAYAEQVEQLTVAAERERMARELHDTLAQGVNGLILLV